MNEYRYSSYYDYNLGVRPHSKILASEGVPDFLHAQDDVSELLQLFKKERPPEAEFTED